MTKEKILCGLKKALEINRYKISGTQITILPTEFVLEVYNFLSDNEKLYLENAND